MPTLPTTHRVALSFLPAKSRAFKYRIYRKELTKTDLALPGTRYLPRDLEGWTSGNPVEPRVRYATSLEARSGYEGAVIDARVEHGLTLEVLFKALKVKCQDEELLRDVEFPEKPFFDELAFVLKRYEAGVREVIWVRPFDLKTLSKFGFLMHFALRVPPDADMSDKRRLELSLTHKNGHLNDDYYLDQYAKVEEFLHRYYWLLREIPLHDGSVVEIERKLPIINSFALQKRVFVFRGNKEGKNQFFGLKNFAPFQSSNSAARLVFIYLASDRAKSQDLFRALRGDTYSTFPGMEEIFRIPLGRQNVSGVEVQGFGNAELLNVGDRLKGQYPAEQIIPVALVPMSKHTSEEETRQYFAAKHAFLSKGLSSQFVDRKKLDDRLLLKWSISNIALALFAKMGGIPWRLKPSTEKCLVVGIGQAHRIVNGKVQRHFAYSVLADSTGIYETIRLLGDSSDPEEYLQSLTSNLRKVLLEHKDRYDSFVLHLTFSMKKREIEAIRGLLHEMSESSETGSEFIALKFNDHNDFFAFSTDHNSRVPYEGVVTPLSRKDFLVWFAGLDLDDSKVPLKPERPVHVRVLYPEKPLSENDLKRVLQDSMNIAGANWRGFNAKSMPISIYYAKLIADFYAHFREANLAEVNLENVSPWFL